jgi:glutamate racemase
MADLPGEKEQHLSLRTSPAYRDAPVAVMDSGVGGLSILHELQQLLPHEDFVFIADQANVPYGERTLAEVRGFVEGITRFALADSRENGRTGGVSAKLMVIACNTASAAALHEMRRMFPQMKFVGLEPAVKPAALGSQKKSIGVIATAVTFQGKLYASLIDRFARDIAVHKRACPELVTLVERGGPYTAEDRQVLEQALAPMIEADIDHLVLGCTHFPFLKDQLQEIMGVGVRIVDPSPAVARQTVRVLGQADARSLRTRPGHTVYVTTGPLESFKKRVQDLLGIEKPDIQSAQWVDGRLLMEIVGREQS